MIRHFVVAEIFWGIVILSSSGHVLCFVELNAAACQTLKKRNEIKYFSKCFPTRKNLPTTFFKGSTGADDVAAWPAFELKLRMTCDKRVIPRILNSFYLFTSKLSNYISLKQRFGVSAGSNVAHD